MRRKPTARPPRPDFIRKPTGRFGWLEDRLLHDGWLGRMGSEATSVLVLLALAADRHGSSFYSRRRMGEVLGMHRQQVDGALRRLLELRLVAQRPWRQGQPDGVWQIMPLPHAPKEPRGGDVHCVGDILESLGLPRSNPTREPEPESMPGPPEMRAS